MLRCCLLLTATLLLTACQATGMGWIPSSVDAGKATFGFVYDGTTEFGTLSGSYHDGEIRFKGTGVLKAGPPPAGMMVKGGCLVGSPSYESQNRDHPGTGIFELSLCDADGDAGMSPFDLIVISLDPLGPLGPYANFGQPSGQINIRWQPPEG